ncbi:MAG: hypothetical protein ACRDE8_00495 [Ginsengibacter sp.]
MQQNSSGSAGNQQQNVIITIGLESLNNKNNLLVKPGIYHHKSM